MTLLIEIFMMFGADNQMSLSCGQDKPHCISKKAIFGCLIGIYVSSFFLEHPVCSEYFFAVDLALYIYSFPL